MNLNIGELRILQKIELETDNGRPEDFLLSVYSLLKCKQKFVVFPFVDEETNGSYQFAHGLNRLTHLYFLVWKNLFQDGHDTINIVYHAKIHFVKNKRKTSVCTKSKQTCPFILFSMEKLILGRHITINIVYPAKIHLVTQFGPDDLIRLGEIYVL